MPKILLVDDDVELTGKLSDWLTKENHDVEIAGSGKDALQLLAHFQYDLIVLDWSLPDGTGIEVCRQFRAAGKQTPIIFLTGKGDIYAKETGLDSGADDYLIKPFEMRELAARMRSLLRRPFGLNVQGLKVGDLELEFQSRIISRGEAKIKLMPRECKLLEFLIRHPDRCYSSKILLNSVCPADIEASEETVRTCMKTLRQKLTKLRKGQLIRTILGSGYILDGK